MSSYQNIIIFNLRKIGDTIMATAAASILRQAYPQAKITMLVKPLTRQIVENNPVIDEVLLYNYSHKAKLSELRATASLLKARSFDLAIVIDNKVRSALLAYLASIPVRVGFEKITLRNIYLKALYTKIYPIDYDFKATLQVKNHQIFLNRFTQGNYEPKMLLPQISTEDKKIIGQILPPTEKKKIALCLRSGVKFKDWPLKRFAAVVKALSERSEVAFYIVGSKSDYQYGEEFKKMVSCPLENLCGKTNLAQLGYFLGQFSLLLSVDTGTAHLAAAANLPVVVVFGGTSHLHWAPYGEKVCALAPQLACYPCSDKERKKCQGYPCLEAVKPQTVFKACEEFLAKY